MSGLEILGPEICAYSQDFPWSIASLEQCSPKRVENGGRVGIHSNPRVPLGAQLVYDQVSHHKRISHRVPGQTEGVGIPVRSLAWSLGSI